jgi:peptidoglycan hydrolase-like protein with peptidoglycan-binding domain
MPWAGRRYYGGSGYHRRAWGRRSPYRGGGRRWGWLHRGAPGYASTPSPLVTWAQGCLAQLLGPWVPQDGIMGPGTRQAIQQFQMQQQLPSTGTLDDNTVSALQAACSGQQAAPDTMGAFPSAPFAPAPFAPQPPAPQPPAPQPPAPPPPAPPPPAGRRHAINPPTGEIGEGEEEFSPGGGEIERHRRTGRWVRREGRVILLGV